MLVVDVTILILVETPLQSLYGSHNPTFYQGHNPYFSGNSFAINKKDIKIICPIKSQSLF